ncbi:MAG: ATP-dependent DNA helicase [Cyclobacteriaceae bacterium]|nr:MAG: ATP-dependent DNA helicase [Cyclobacteriaceae bacterium]
MLQNSFNQAVSQWFNKYLGEPTDIQKQAWPAIKEQQHTLISAPTGSGKTLAAFLAIIDNMITSGLEGNLEDKTQVVYVSPLKALSNDIHKNLQVPLEGIKKILHKNQLTPPEIRVALRTGDTPNSQRTAMYRTPPHILVTTPESLYLLLTSINGRKMLEHVGTVIVDEIHAILESKRGSHLALSIERLDRLTPAPLTRIGLSATQKPIETVACFLTGSKPCTIVDTGHSRNMDVAIEVTASPLEAVMSNEVWAEIYQRLQGLILSHDTTLIFVNTRRLAERMAYRLTEMMGPELITAHHGSMSKEHRLEAEQKLKSGKLKALIATASMELGIDIGTVDLVCQMGSPRSIANFLQRVGRSGHSVKGTPKGRLFPLSRDELVESAALMQAIKYRELDTLEIPEQPIDVLAQQIVAEVANHEYGTKDLYQLVTRAFPYRNLSLKDFNEVLDMLAQGYALRQGRRGAYLFRDLVNDRLVARKGARLAAIMSGGAIPDNFDVDVILDPSGTFIGSLNEDFALESLPGQVFQLGNNSYRVLRMETGKMRVEDAHGQPPNIPFWLGEAPGRSWELSAAVSRFRDNLSELFGEIPDSTTINGTPQDSWKQPAIHWLQEELNIESSAGDQIVDYLAAGMAALGVMPSHENLVLERFFDEAGDQHLVVHAPFGSRINRAWGLALRKKFCRRFNFELQAAANENAIIMSLGATHSFPLEEVYQYLNSRTLKEVLIQALLDAPMFGIHWRWNASIALAVPRRRAGQRVPPQIQRMQAEDLVALVFPDQLACLENIAGDREVPDHPLVRQTIGDCLYDAMDLSRLERIIDKIRDNSIGLHSANLREASPFASEILSSKPYTFIDDTPFEERRTLAVNQRRWIEPSEAKELGKLDPQAIDLVKEEAWIEAETEHELHDGLLVAGYITESELRATADKWQELIKTLLEQKRIVCLKINDNRWWIAIERLPEIRKIHPQIQVPESIKVPLGIKGDNHTFESSLVELLRSRLEVLGPVTVEQLVRDFQLPASALNVALLTLEQEGFVFQGNFSSIDQTEWCERRLLARIHRYTLRKLRREIAPVAAADFMRYLFEWQFVANESQLEGPQALENILDQLEGFEAPAASWEGELFPARIKDYDYLWLDVHCLSGNFIWGRFINKTLARNPVKTTPLAFIRRAHTNLWQYLRQPVDANGLTGNNQQVWHYLQKQGASFFNQITSDLKLLKVEVENCLGELVSYGLITSDSFNGLRALLVPGKFKVTHSRKRKPTTFNIEEAGRWSIIERTSESQELGQEELIELARVLLRRYGVVFRKLVDREKSMPPWRDLVRVFRLMEARGQIRGGRFVTGVWGEQFALKEAITKLRSVTKKTSSGELVTISATDPLNLTGIITPGTRISGIIHNRILYLDGEPVAVKNGKEVNFLKTPDKSDKWTWQNALIQRQISPRLRPYLGKGIV